MSKPKKKEPLPALTESEFQSFKSLTRSLDHPSLKPLSKQQRMLLNSKDVKEFYARVHHARHLQILEVENK